MIAMNNVTTTNAYSAANTREQHLTVRVVIQVLNANVFVQLADEQGNFGVYDEEFYAVGGYSINRVCGGARVRSAAVGVAAQVSITLLQRADVP